MDKEKIEKTEEVARLAKTVGELLGSYMKLGDVFEIKFIKEKKFQIQLRIEKIE